VIDPPWPMTQSLSPMPPLSKIFVEMTKPAAQEGVGMTDIFPPTKQRPALLAFAEACDSRAPALRRDECGDWAIWGANGHIYAVEAKASELRSTFLADLAALREGEAA
jgi:hypothetical protein